jgi:uncharacterized protein YgiM (DUF1202 family)
MVNNLSYSQEYKERNGGRVFRTVVNDDKVNVRYYPSLSGDKITQLMKGHKVIVLGISNEPISKLK